MKGIYEISLVCHRDSLGHEAKTLLDGTKLKYSTTSLEGEATGLASTPKIIVCFQDGTETQYLGIRDCRSFCLHVAPAIKEEQPELLVA